MLLKKILFYLFLFLFSNTIISQEEKAVNNSSIAFTVNEKDLLPESIAYDEATHNFYITSTRKGKIVKVSKDGKAEDYITSKQDGLWMAIGLQIDSKRRLLWVCSTGGDNLIDYYLKDDVDGRPAGIFKFNLDTGKLIKKYTLEDTGIVHFFNDLSVTKEGDVYVTHTFKEHAIYKIAANRDVLEKAYTADFIKYPNGITLSDDETKLFVAHAEGIAVIDLKIHSVKALEVPETLKVTRRESIDGIYFYKNTLIGLQPDIKTVQQFILDKDFSKITASKLLEVNHPMMDYPTTGELVADEFYYVANSQFGKFNKDGSLFSMDKLYQPVVLKLKLE